MPDEFDWIQLDSDEWLKGEIIAMYQESLEFDSDKLENLSFDFADVRKIRSAAPMLVGLVGGGVVRGKLVIDGDRVLVIGDETRELERRRGGEPAQGPPGLVTAREGPPRGGLLTRKPPLYYLRSAIRLAP